MWSSTTEDGGTPPEPSSFRQLFLQHSGLYQSWANKYHAIECVRTLSNGRICSADGPHLIERSAWAGRVQAVHLYRIKVCYRLMTLAVLMAFCALMVLISLRIDGSLLQPWYACRSRQWRLRLQRWFRTLV